ncbi:MAG: 4a-hydroxytetrahydrobiopterin dehydratase [Alphaproteobacteria bacterium]|nr:4a-hydroxytetrahydrobiopterin dehydratase [Alphaproteobacteria bacterium]MBF0394252.1 4a-hydroxytetrahydrobiopterin dehydratase [Alphaproteobacteria bacterium]
MALHEKTCTPCRGGVEPLGPDQAAVFARDIPEWELREAGTRLVRDLRFKNFAEALSFVDRVGALAESAGHHPDICFGWGYASVTLFTHKIGGLHENDFIMAAKIDRLSRGDGS